MQKSLFAGLTILDPEESILDDSGAFIGQDREIIDRYLELGAKTHRHTGLSGLGDPTQSLGASAVSSAGMIDGGLAFDVGYTLEDDTGGETMLSPLTAVSTEDPIDPPTEAPTVVMDTSAGDLMVDTYYYAFSLADADGGETTIGPATPVERQPGFEHSRAQVSGLSIGSAAAPAWRLYRAVGGGDFHYLASGTGDAYTDDGSVSVNCDILPLSDDLNTTNGTSSLIVHLPSADALVDDATAINVYFSDDGTFTGEALWQQFPRSSAGRSVVAREIETFEGQPPDVSTSVGTAHLIDPDTELLDWHWKRPVANHGALPGSGNFDGDVRIVRDESAAYEWNGSMWVGMGGGGGGGGSVIVSNALTDGGFDDFDGPTLDGAWTSLAGDLGTADFDTPGFVHNHRTDEFGWSSVMIGQGAFGDGDGTMKVNLAADQSAYYLFKASGTDEDGDLMMLGIKFGNGGAGYNGVALGLWDSSLGGWQTELDEQLATGGAGVATGDWWVVMSISGNVITYELWNTDPDLGGSPDYSGGATLTGGNATQFGAGQTGKAGLYLSDPETLYDFWSFGDAATISVEAERIVFDPADFVITDLGGGVAGISLA